MTGKCRGKRENLICILYIILLGARKEMWKDSAPDVPPFWPLGGDIVLTVWLLASKLSQTWSEDRELFNN